MAEQRGPEGYGSGERNGNGAAEVLADLLRKLRLLPRRKRPPTPPPRRPMPRPQPRPQPEARPPQPPPEAEPQPKEDPYEKIRQHLQDKWRQKPEYSDDQVEHLKDRKREQSPAARSTMDTLQAIADAKEQRAAAEAAGTELDESELPTPPIEIQDPRITPGADIPRPSYLELLRRLSEEETGEPPSAGPTEHDEAVDAAMQRLRDYEEHGDIIKFGTDQEAGLSKDRQFRTWNRMSHEVERLYQQDRERLGDRYLSGYNLLFDDPNDKEVGPAAIARRRERAAARDVFIETLGEFSLEEKRQYDEFLKENQDTIRAIAKAYLDLMSEDVGKTRMRPGNRVTEAGIDLSDAHLTDVIVASIAGQNHIEAFQIDEPQTEHKSEVTGRNDFYFALDTSGSMAGGRDVAARASVLICAEAIASIQRELKRREGRGGLKRGTLQNRTMIVAFGVETSEWPGGVRVLKDLSSDFSLLDKLRTFTIYDRGRGGLQLTPDYNAWPVIEEKVTQGAAEGRQQVVLSMTDGVSYGNEYIDEAIREAEEINARNRDEYYRGGAWQRAADPNRLAMDKSAEASKRGLNRLRKAGARVQGILIQTSDDYKLYGASARRCDDPQRELPGIVRGFVLKTLLDSLAQRGGRATPGRPTPGQRRTS